MFTTKLYLAVERDPTKEPLTDVQVIVGDGSGGRGKQRDPKLPKLINMGDHMGIMGYFRVETDLNRGGIGKNVYLHYSKTYREGQPRSIVMDIVLIVPKLGERCPGNYVQLDENLNAGAFRDAMYMCIKSCTDSPLENRYKAVVLDRFPYVDLQGNPFPEALPVFCYPQGAEVVVGDNPPLPKCTTFILTNESGLKLHGVCINFHEKLAGEMKAALAGAAQAVDDEGGEEGASPSVLEQAISVALSQKQRVWMPKTVCLVSHWPFYRSFTTFLVELWRLTLGSSTLPPERYLSNLWETPLPLNSRVNVDLKIAGSRIVFDRPPTDTLPLANFDYNVLFKCLSLESIVKVLSALFMERTILLVSKHSSLLTPASEALLSFMFPFQWQFPYVPVLPTAVVGLDLLMSPGAVFLGMNITYVDPTILAKGNNTVFVNLDEDIVRVFGVPIKPIPKPYVTTLIRELKQEGHVDSIPNLHSEEEEKIGSEFLFKQLPSADTDPNSQFQPQAVRAAFVHLTVSLLGNTHYRTCLKFPHMSVSYQKPEFGMDDIFNRQRFLSIFPRSCLEFQRMFVGTQAFARLTDEKTLLSDRHAELEFFDACCNYESKYIQASMASPRGARRTGPPSLVQHLTAAPLTASVYRMPAPDSKGLEEKIYSFPDGFPILNLKLFYKPRPVEEKYMESVTTERRTSLKKEFKSAFFKKDFVRAKKDGVGAARGSGFTQGEVDRWVMAILACWFQLQVAKLTKRDEWELKMDSGLKKVMNVFRVFENVGKNIVVPKNKKGMLMLSFLSFFFSFIVGRRARLFFPGYICVHCAPV